MAKREAPEFSPKVERHLRAATLRFEIGTIEFLLGDTEDDLELLAELGELYTKAGHYDKGLRLDLRLVELAPENPVAHYNLGCSYALLGQADAALAALDRAIVKGYRDLHHLERDRDLMSLRCDARFTALCTRLRAMQAHSKDRADER